MSELQDMINILLAKYKNKKKVHNDLLAQKGQPYSEYSGDLHGLPDLPNSLPDIIDSYRRLGHQITILKSDLVGGSNKNSILDFNTKFKKYARSKYDLSKIITDKNIFFGSGGSSNVIVVHDNIVLKIIPEFKKFINMKVKNNNDQVEIEFYEFLTQKLLKPNITPHIVGMYNHYKLYDIKVLFPGKCLSESELLLINPKKVPYVKKILCSLKKQYNIGIILPQADVVVLEYCPGTIENEILNILKSKSKLVPRLQEFVDRTIFQFIYTMAKIQDMYPRFIHNDLFLRNVLGVSQENFDTNDYVQYIYKNKSYYLPANGFYIKINDFGYSLNPPHIVSTLFNKIKDDPISHFAYDDKLRDTFTFLFDFYDGANIGQQSVMSLLKKKSSEIRKKIRGTFKKYIDVSVIDKISKLNRHELIFTWNIKDVGVLRKTVVEPAKYFSQEVFKKYSVLPKNGKVVATFGE